MTSLNPSDRSRLTIDNADDHWQHKHTTLSPRMPTTFKSITTMLRSALPSALFVAIAFMLDAPQTVYFCMVPIAQALAELPFATVSSSTTDK